MEGSSFSMANPPKSQAFFDLGRDDFAIDFNDILGPTPSFQQVADIQPASDQYQPQQPSFDFSWHGGEDPFGFDQGFAAPQPASENGHVTPTKKQEGRQFPAQAIAQGSDADISMMEPGEGQISNESSGEHSALEHSIRSADELASVVDEPNAPLVRRPRKRAPARLRMDQEIMLPMNQLIVGYDHAEVFFALEMEADRAKRSKPQKNLDTHAALMAELNRPQALFGHVLGKVLPNTILFGTDTLQPPQPSTPDVSTEMPLNDPVQVK